MIIYTKVPLIDKNKQIKHTKRQAVDYLKII